jgi:hypothetical protein
MQLALHALNGLMRHLPNSGSGLRMHNLHLLAVTAGNCHGDVRPLHLYLGHDRPPGIILQLSIVGVNRAAPSFRQAKFTPFQPEDHTNRVKK